MNWTTDKPTRPGWYWFQPGVDSPVGRATILDVMQSLHTRLPEGGGIHHIRNLSGRWAGPIEEPT